MWWVSDHPGLWCRALFQKKRDKRRKEEGSEGKGYHHHQNRQQSNQKPQHGIRSPSLLRSLPSVSLASLWITPSERDLDRDSLRELGQKAQNNDKVHSFLPGVPHSTEGQRYTVWFSATDSLITSFPIRCPESLSWMPQRAQHSVCSTTGRAVKTAVYISYSFWRLLRKWWETPKVSAGGAHASCALTLVCAYQISVGIITQGLF